MNKKIVTFFSSAALLFSIVYSAQAFTELKNAEMEEVTGQASLTMVINNQMKRTHIKEITYFPSNNSYYKGHWKYMNNLPDPAPFGTTKEEHYKSNPNDDTYEGWFVAGEDGILFNTDEVYVENDAWYFDTGSNTWKQGSTLDDKDGWWDPDDNDYMDRKYNIYVVNGYPSDNPKSKQNGWILWGKSYGLTPNKHQYQFTGEWQNDEEIQNTALTFGDISLHGTKSTMDPYSQSGIINMDITTSENKYSEIRLTYSDFKNDLSVDIGSINFCGNSNENGPVSGALSIKNIQTPSQHLYITSPSRYGKSNEGIAFELGMQKSIEEIKYMPNQNPSQDSKNITLKGILLGKTIKNLDVRDLQPNYDSPINGTSDAKRYAPVNIPVEVMQETANSWEAEGEMQIGDLDGDLDGNGTTNDMESYLPNGAPTAAIINVASGPRPALSEKYTPPGNSNPANSYVAAWLPLPPGSIAVKDFRMNGESFGPIVATNMRGYVYMEIPGRNYDYSHVDLHLSAQHYKETPVSFNANGMAVAPDGK